MSDFNNEIYLKPKEKIYIKSDMPISIGDTCDILGENMTIDKINNLKLQEHPYEKEMFVIELLYVISVIKKEFPKLSISILSESDILVQVENSKETNKIIEISKVVLVSIFLFIGAGTAIMNFHADVNMEGVHQKFYEFVTGQQVKHPLWISIPYSLGIGIGMIVFFNHISPKKRKTNHPSPLDLELYSYQNNEDDFIRQKTKERRHD